MINCQHEFRLFMWLERSGHANLWSIKCKLYLLLLSIARIFSHFYLGGLSAKASFSTWTDTHLSIGFSSLKYTLQMHALSSSACDCQLLFSFFRTSVFGVYSANWGNFVSDSKTHLPLHIFWYLPQYVLDPSEDFVDFEIKLRAIHDYLLTWTFHVFIYSFDVSLCLTFWKFV